jgi:hypothetical protein
MPARTAVNKGVEVDALQVFSDECQARLAAQVVGQLFDHKFAHLISVLFHLQGEEKMEAKLLISIGKVRILSGQLTDPGSSSTRNVIEPLMIGFLCSMDSGYSPENAMAPRIPIFSDIGYKRWKPDSEFY